MIGEALLTGILDILKVLMVVVWFVAALAEFGQWLTIRHERYAWVKLALGVMGLYWGIYYLRSLLGVTLPAHQIWVRAPLVLTGAFVGAGALMSLLRKYNGSVSQMWKALWERLHSKTEDR